MNCSNIHATRRDHHCPYCIVRMLYLALEKHNPNAPELTPAAVLLTNAHEESQREAKEYL